jgi:hypothetical protein
MAASDLVASPHSRFLHTRQHSSVEVPTGHEPIARLVVLFLALVPRVPIATASEALERAFPLRRRQLSSRRRRWCWLCSTRQLIRCVRQLKRHPPTGRRCAAAVRVAPPWCVLQRQCFSVSVSNIPCGITFALALTVCNAGGLASVTAVGCVAVGAVVSLV